MFRDDEAARAAYLAALERTAARVAELEDRVRELEAENRELHALLPRGTRPVSTEDIYVDPKIEQYVDALINATHPSRTDGIRSGATAGSRGSLLSAARIAARREARDYVVPEDVRRAALEVLPTRITMQNPEADSRVIVRAILDFVEVP